MKRVKMTYPDKEKGRQAGLVYEVTDKEAKQYADKEQAVEIKVVKHGDG